MSIDIEIKADIGDALSKVDQLKAKLGQTKENIELLKQELKDMSSSLSKNDKEIAAVNKSLSSLNTTTRDGQKEAAGLRAQLAQLATTNSTLVTGIRTTKVELAAEQEAMKGLGKEVKDAETAGSGFSKGLSAIFGGLRKIAYLIPGIGLAGLIGLLTGPLISAFESLLGKESEFAKGQREFTESLAEVGKKAISTGAQLQAFVNIAKDGNLPLAQRNEALKEANKILGEHGQKLTLASVGTAAATKEVELYTQALINEAIAAKYADRIADLRIKQTEATKKYGAAIKEAAAAQMQADRTGSLGSGGIGGTGLNVTTATQSARAINNAKDAAKEYREISDALITTTDELFQTELKATAAFAELGTKAKESTKKVETVADVLAKLGREISFLDSKELELGTNETKAKISAIESAIQHLIRDLKVPRGSTVIEKLFGDINELLPFLAQRVGSANLKIKTSAEILVDAKQAEKEINDKLGKDGRIQPIKIPIEFADTKDRSAKSKFPEFPREGAKDYLEKLQNFYADIDKQNQNAADNIKDTLNSAFASIGESIAQSFESGASFGEIVFGNLFKVLGAGIKQLGEAMITLGTAKIVIEKFKIAPGIATVLAGIATVALGSLLQNALPGFAGGVQNFGGGLALVGERGPEIVNLPRGSDVIPNHRLNSLGTGTGVQVFIPETRISGADIVISYTRQQARNSRNS